jgi:hypothetical protein
MNQLNLFPARAPRPTRYELILAVFPDEETARRIYELGAHLRNKHG